MKRPFGHMPHPLTLSQVLMGNRRSISATAQNSLLGAAFCRGELCSGNKPQPQCVLAHEGQACLVTHLALCTPRAKKAMACLWLCGHCCLSGGLRGLKPTPHVFSFVEKADWA